MPFSLDTHFPFFYLHLFADPHSRRTEQSMPIRRILLFPNSMTLSVYICPHVACALLLLFHCSSTFCLGGHYEECFNNQACGSFEFGYPFGKINSGCGVPEFQLYCDLFGFPLLNISGNIYHITEPSFLGNAGSHTMTVLNDNLWVSINKCNLSGNYTQSSSPGSKFFQIADVYNYLTFWRNCTQIYASAKLSLQICGDDWYYSLAPDLGLKGARYCTTQIQLPIRKNLSLQPINLALVLQGFEITWKVDPNNEQSCSRCLKSKGSCGYNASEPTKFLCYCPDGTSPPDECSSANVPQPTSHGGEVAVPSPISRGSEVAVPETIFSHGDHTKKSILIGCSIGGAALTAIAVALLTFYLKRGKHSLHRGSSTSKVEKFLKEYAYEMPTRYSQSRLKKITNNYAEKLGEGGYGVVYKGKLPNDVLVAVKLLDRHRHSETQFMNEVATIGLVHHVNLVRLLGYCFETPTSALVYEYMVNGSLEKFIFAGKEKGQILGWEQLHSIALGTARGIAYLHQDCEKRIIHFDIKPHNILLDSDFTPKVADFGLAKLCVKEVDHLSMTAARGTPGYVAPEVCDSNVGPVTDKSDVYSFGMLLLEIVGGRKNFDWKVSRSSQYYFPEWVFKALDSGELAVRLRGEEETEAEDEEKARRLTKVGLWCIQYNYRDRPCMNRVVQMLEGIGDDVSNPPLPINSSTTIENTCENPLLSST